MSSLDSLISTDLAALGEDSRRQLVNVDDALRTTNMYRDDRPGAEARRDALADERRRELVMMPLTLSHVFAHRVGRAAAGATALVCALALVAMIADPLLMRLAGWVVPGLNMGMLVALSAIKVLAVYVIATWFAEAWFARRMRQAIETGKDAYHDLDHLARGPVEIAHHAVQRVDAISLGLFFAGVTSLVVAFGYLGVVVGTLHTLPLAWSVSGIAATSTLGNNLDILVVCIAGVCGLGIAIGRGCRRGAESTLVRVLGHWSTAVAALVIALGTAYSSFHMLATLGMRRELPRVEERYALAIGATIAIVGAASWALLWWRRREQARIGD